MTTVSAKHLLAGALRRSTYYELDIPRVGILNVDLFGPRPWKHFSIGLDKRHQGAAFFGPAYIEFAYLPETRAQRGTAAVIAMVALALAGWTEGHLWHLPFLG